MKIYLDGVNTNSLESMYKEIVNNWNIEEKRFRTIVRKEDLTFKNWRVKNCISRQIIISGNKFYYNLTRYKDTVTNKTFTYYHNNILQIIRNKKYYYEDVWKAIKDNNFTRKKLTLNSSKVPYWIFYYWKKHRIIEFEKQINNFKKTAKDKTLQIDIDDSYKTFRIKNKVEKLRIRVLVFHTGYNNLTGNVENKTLLIQKSFTNVSIENQRFFDEKLIAKIKQINDNIYGNLNIVIHGDGGQFINQIAKKLNVKRYFDYFHLKKIAFENLGWNKTRFKKNKENLGLEFAVVFKKFNDFINEKKLDEAVELLTKTRNYLELNDKKIELKKINDFIKLIKNHRQSIENTISKNGYYGGCPEIWIGHDIKRFCSKKFAVYSFNTFINQIKLNITNRTNFFMV